MRKMFEQAVDDYRIVNCIRSKYSKSGNNSDNFEIIDGGFNKHIKLSPTIDDFIGYIKSNVLDGFVSSQEESIYKNIKRFIEILGDYDHEFRFLFNTDSSGMKSCFSLLQSKFI